MMRYSRLFLSNSAAAEAQAAARNTALVNRPYPKLFNPLKIGEKFTLPNRCIMSPMYMNFEEDYDHSARNSNYFDTMAAFYAQRARNDVGLIISGGIAPSKLGRWHKDAISLTDTATAAKLRVVSDAVHREGSKMFLQAFHGGRHCRRRIGIDPSPNAVEQTVSHLYEDDRLVFKVPSFLIDYVVSEYARFASLAEIAGFDGVEIPVSEGSLLHCFFSPAMNDRDDAFGGTVEKRAEIIYRVLERIKEDVKDKDNFGVSVRLCVHDLHPNGSTMNDVKYLAENIASSGYADIITTSVGLWDSPVNSTSSYVPRAAFARSIKAVKEHLTEKGFDIPVFGSHRINRPEVAEKLLEDDVCDGVMLGRALLADSAFVSNAKNGDADASLPCVACGHCFNKLYRHLRVGCAANPFSGYETERTIKPATEQKNVAVVGAGPAGITAALMLSDRGHNVVLYEQAAEIGGQLNYAKLIPGKTEYHEWLKFWARSLQHSRVKVLMKASFETKDISRVEQSFHAIVFAMGAQVLPITSAKIRNASEEFMHVTWKDILRKRAIAGRRVAILGKGAIAHDVASYLVHDHRVATDVDRFADEWGIDLENGTVDKAAWTDMPKNNREITVCQVFDTPPDLSKGRSWFLRKWLRNHGASLIPHLMWAGMDKRGIQLSDWRQSKRREYVLPCDTIVNGSGMAPSFKEAMWIHEYHRDGAKQRGELKSDFSMYPIGSCRETELGEANGEHDIMRVIKEAWEVGSKI